MSALVMVLPQVWAMASAPAMRPGEKFGPGAVRLALVTRTAVPEAARLTLVQAKAESAMKPTPDPELAFYRKYTEGMLRRYMRLSLQGGRTPSLLGREMFRGKVTNYTLRSFDDAVIFVHDVKSCLERLPAGQQHLVRRIAIEEYTQGETAAMLGISLRTVVRQYAAAVDALTALFLERRLLEPHTSCQ